MDVIGHDDEADAKPISQPQFLSQDAQQDALALVMLQPPAPFVTRGRDERSAAEFVQGPLANHAGSLP